MTQPARTDHGNQLALLTISTTRSPLDLAYSTLLLANLYPNTIGP